MKCLKINLRDVLGGSVLETPLLPMQGTQLQALGREDPTHPGAAERVQQL